MADRVHEKSGGVPDREERSDAFGRTLHERPSVALYQVAHGSQVGSGEPEEAIERRVFRVPQRQAAADHREPGVHEGGSAKDRVRNAALRDPALVPPFPTDGRDFLIQRGHGRRYENELPDAVAAAGFEQVAVASVLHIPEAVAGRRQDRVRGADHRLDVAASQVDVLRYAQVPQCELRSRDGARGRSRPHEGAHRTSSGDHRSHDRRPELPGGADHENQE